MALADFADMVDKVRYPVYATQMSKDANTTSGDTDTVWVSQLLRTGNPTAPSAPTTAAALDNTSAGRLIKPGSAGFMFCSGVHEADSNNNNVPRTPLFLIDRLSHQGGLVGNTTGAQTTNLPTAALTRYTDGVGVMIGLHIHTALGSTDSNVTISYTNQAGTSGRTATVHFIDTPSASFFYWACLQAGDSGAKSVESVTLSASTLTAGAFGVVLFKPIQLIYATPNADVLRGLVPSFSQIHSDAFLELLRHRDGFPSAGVNQTRLEFSEC